MECRPVPPLRTPLTTIMELETTNDDDPAPEGYPEYPAVGSWLTARGRRGRRADAESDPAAGRQETQHLKQIRPRRRGRHLCLSMVLKSSCAQETVSRSGQEVEEDHLRVQVAENIALISTPSERIAINLNKMASLTLGPHRYPMSTYIAPPDNSCKGIITGPDTGTTPTELLDHLLAPAVEILHARMMGRAVTTIITFAGLKVPHYVRYYAAEYRCYIQTPRTQAPRVKIPPESVNAMCRDLQHELRRELHRDIQEMRENILAEVKEMIRAAFVGFQTTVLKPVLHEITN
ncbi:hypothetical protein HPB49_016129 [Dermacentor silvarum]|uniref:Uncharacterized protein n=1 Tax=Dermacentor silvarum TaxID=543639 RepID=A0ACB8CG76_DERSI|nr:hypothetical protein HPB49_016129 [Dermacentor silvarum]